MTRTNRFGNRSGSTIEILTEVPADAGTEPVVIGSMKIRTAQCAQCRRWFKATRPATVMARWPSFCSGDCRAMRRALQRRKSDARRKDARKASQTYRFQIFDAASPDAAWIAHAIVTNLDEMYASPAAVTAARKFIAEHDEAERNRRAVEKQRRWMDLDD